MQGSPVPLVVDGCSVGWMHIVRGSTEAIVRITAERDDPRGGDGVVPAADLGFLSIRDLPPRHAGGPERGFGAGWTVASGRVDAALAPSHATLLDLVSAVSDHVLGDEIQVNLRVDVTHVTVECTFDGESRDTWQPVEPA